MFYRLVEIIKGGSRPSMDEMLEDSDRHLQNLDTLILPAPESKPRTPFNSDVPVEEVSMANLTARQKLTVLPKALPLFANMRLGARMYDGTFQPTKSEVTPEFISDLEKMAKDMGAKDLGYVKVPRNAIFQRKGLPYDNAIMFTVEMNKELIDTSPSFASQAEVMDGYKRMAIISRKLAQHLRKHGYAAYPGMALGGITDYVYLAELAGLGAIGYHGLLISPGEGARLRINTIYTNITNLPTLQVTGGTNEHLWVRDFCAMCKKCVRQCPVDAIFDEPQPRGDGGMQTIEHATCREYFTRHYGCAVCLAICPFSRVGYDKVKARFRGNPGAPQFRIQLPAVDLAQIGVLNHAGNVRENPYARKKTIAPDTLQELEEYAHGLGITDIGYTPVNTRQLFKRFRILYPNAIVFTMEMDKEKIKQAPSIPSFIEIFRTYHQLGVVVNKVADFLGERGYNALAQPAIGGDINMIPVAIDAGLS